MNWKTDIPIVVGCALGVPLGVELFGVTPMLTGLSVIVLLHSVKINE